MLMVFCASLVLACIIILFDLTSRFLHPRNLLCRPVFLGHHPAMNLMLIEVYKRQVLVEESLLRLENVLNICGILQFSFAYFGEVFIPCFSSTVFVRAFVYYLLSSTRHDITSCFPILDLDFCRLSSHFAI